MKRPSDDPEVCGECHPEIAATYKKSLHYTTIGQRNRVIKRMSADEAKIFDEKVFKKSCNSCHATCGDCHVKSPTIGGVSIGLISKHKFVRRDEGKTCAFCHGGRVYPEYTGEYGGNRRCPLREGHDVHGVPHHGRNARGRQGLRSKGGSPDRPAARTVMNPAGSRSLTARVAHPTHSQKASCFACHSAGEYRNAITAISGEAPKPSRVSSWGRTREIKGRSRPLRLIPTVQGQLQARRDPAGTFRCPAQLLGFPDPQHPEANRQDPHTATPATRIGRGSSPWKPF